MKFGDKVKNAQDGTTTYHGGDYNSYTDFVNSVFSLSENQENFRFVKSDPEVFIVAKMFREQYLKIELELNIKKLVRRFQEFRENRNVRLNVADAPRYNVHGEIFDAGRFISGDPECMINFYGDYAIGAKMVDIELSPGLPMWVADLKDGQNKLFEHFAGILDIIDQLESQGTRCQIIAKFAGCDQREKSRYKNDIVQYSYVFKKHSEIFDIELFCKIFLTKLAGLAGLIMSTMLSKMNAKNNYCGTYCIHLDYTDENANRFDPEKPDLIKYPSLWRPWKANFRKESAADILHDLGYDII